MNLIKIINLLIASGANLNLQDEDGETMLMFAITDYNLDISIEIVKLLIDYGADLNLQTNEGFTALMMLCNKNDKETNVSSIELELIKLLIDPRADLNLQDNQGRTVLIIACSHKNSSIEVVKLLIDSGIKLNIQDKDGDTALMMASYFDSDDSIEIIELLINSGANLHIVDNYGHTCFGKLVQFSNSLDFVKKIIQKNVIINHVTHKGNTLLHLCTISIKENTSNYDILAFLETLNIDKTLKNDTGKTYLDYLEICYYVATICEICYDSNNSEFMAVLNCECNCARQCIFCVRQLDKCCYCKNSFDGYQIIKLLDQTQ
jgi:ankyrin repeat protein